MESLLQLKNVEKVSGQGANTFKALEDNSFTIDHGEFVGIMGQSVLESQHYFMGASRYN